MGQQDDLSRYVGRVSPNAISLYLYLRSISAENEVTASVAEIAEGIERSDAYTQRYLAELIQAQMITRERRHDQRGGNLSSKYQLLV